MNVYVALVDIVIWKERSLLEDKDETLRSVWKYRLDVLRTNVKYDNMKLLTRLGIAFDSQYHNHKKTNKLR